MDLMLVVIGVFAYGVAKMMLTGGFKEETAVLHDDGTVTYPEDNLPIGTNLTLMSEPDAFTLILKELGLM